MQFLHVGYTIFNIVGAHAHLNKNLWQKNRNSAQGLFFEYIIGTWSHGKSEKKAKPVAANIPSFFKGWGHHFLPAENRKMEKSLEKMLWASALIMSLSCW